MSEGRKKPFAKCAPPFFVQSTLPLNSCLIVQVYRSKDLKSVLICKSGLFNQLHPHPQLKIVDNGQTLLPGN